MGSWYYQIGLANTLAASHPQPLLLAAKKKASPPSPEPPKLVAAWTGNAYDLGIGGAIGLMTGVAVGKVVRQTVSTATWSALALLPFAWRVSLVALAMDQLQKAHFLTVHWDTISDVCKKIISVNGKVKRKDFEGLFSSRFFSEGSVPHAIFKKIDVNSDGTLDLDDAAALYEKNGHAATGGFAGFAVGFAGSVGAPPFRF